MSVISRSFSVAASIVLSATTADALLMSHDDGRYVERLGGRVTISPFRRENGIIQRNGERDAKFKYFHGEPLDDVSDRVFQPLSREFHENDKLHLFVAKTHIKNTDAKHTEVLVAKTTVDDSGLEVYKYKSFSFGTGDKVINTNLGNKSDPKYSGGFLAAFLNYPKDYLIPDVDHYILEAVMRITPNERPAPEVLQMMCGKGQFQCERGVYKAFDLMEDNDLHLMDAWKPQNPVRYAAAVGLPWGNWGNCHSYAHAMFKKTNPEAKGFDLQRPWAKWVIVNRIPVSDKMLNDPERSVLNKDNGTSGPKWNEPALTLFIGSKDFKQFVKEKDEELFEAATEEIRVSRKLPSSFFSEEGERQLREYRMEWALEEFSVLNKKKASLKEWTKWLQKANKLAQEISDDRLNPKIDEASLIIALLEEFSVLNKKKASLQEWKKWLQKANKLAGEISDESLNLKIEEASRIIG